METEITYTVCQYDSHLVTPADCSASLVGDQQDCVRRLPGSTHGAVTATAITRLPVHRITGAAAPTFTKLIGSSVNICYNMYGTYYAAKASWQFCCLCNNLPRCFTDIIKNEVDKIR